VSSKTSKLFCSYEGGDTALAMVNYDNGVWREAFANIFG
jgi:hypothetical protein